MSLENDDELPDDQNVLSIEERLLKIARNGDIADLKHLLANTSVDKSLLNCKGTSKANREWTPLHLASYFGHAEVLEFLIQNGADVDATNDKGDTPLHKAAYTGRLDAVTILLKSNADINIVNTEGKTPLHVSKGNDVKELIKAAQLTESGKIEKKYLKYASNGDLHALETLIKQSKSLNINCVDSLGNSALHLAAYRDHQQIAAFLMQAGIKSDIKNNQNHIAEDVAISQGMKLVLSLTPLSDLKKSVNRFEGTLYKKTRLLGFKPKYVVLDKGVLSIFSSLADASSGVRRRTYKYLDDAQCLVQSKDDDGFAIVYNNGSNHIFRVELSGDSKQNVLRQKWVNSIRQHIAYSTYYMHKGLNVEESDEELLPISSITDALQTAQAHQTTLEKEVKLLVALTDSLLANFGVNPNSLTLSASYGTKSNVQDAVSKCSKIASDSRDMCNVLQHCVTLLTQQEELRSQQLKEEKERCRVLQESLRVLAVQQHELEQQLENSGGFKSPMENSSDEEEFFDCDISEGSYKIRQQEINGNEQALNNTNYLDYKSNNMPRTSEKPSDVLQRTESRRLRLIQKQPFGCRKELPAPMISRNDFSVWTILKQCIGKELSKITMPVVFNEPISFLQRITEYMEYSYLLERADACNLPEERLAYVVAFAVSACSSNWDRLGKPFNPLLGETYELERKDLDYKVVCEQVSHHPPISAFHVTADKYKVYGAINPKLKFWGKSVEITPEGLVTVELSRHGESYSWENVNCSVHNIIVGKLWVEHHGRMEVTNHKTGHKADIIFKKSNMFSKEVHKIEGTIQDRSNNKLLVIYGSWTDALFSVPPDVWEDYSKTKAKSSVFESDVMKSLSKTLSNDQQEEEVPQRSSNFDLKIPGQTFLWQVEERPSNSDQYYSFTKYALMLNEIDETTKHTLSPTDCRLRPDIRCLELGNIDQAAEKKHYLEEKQRNTRKVMKKNKEEWTPRWFRWTTHPVTGKLDWIYQGAYWNRDWKSCPDIY